MSEQDSTAQWPIVPNPKTRGFVDHAGEQIGYLKVIGYVGADNRRSMWLCRCKCGRFVRLAHTTLASSRQNSCGCLRSALASTRSKTHGLCAAKSSLVAKWHAMVKRCHDPENREFHNYGGRGIIVCDRWRFDIRSFAADMGEPPTSKHSLERIDVNGNYEPSNCRWATSFDQTRNMRRNRTITIGGITRCVADWCAAIGISATDAYHRVGRGWSWEKALTTPRIGPTRKTGRPPCITCGKPSVAKGMCDYHYRKSRPRKRASH